MFISRKKYEEALEAARKEGAEKAWEQQQKECYINDICRRFEEVDKRLTRLEPEPVDPCHCSTCNSRYPMPY